MKRSRSLNEEDTARRVRKTIATPSSSANAIDAVAATAQVFGTTDLLEHILSFADCMTLHVIRGVCKEWSAVISRQFEEHLFFSPVKGSTSAWHFAHNPRQGGVRAAKSVTLDEHSNMPKRLPERTTLSAVVHPLLKISTGISSSLLSRLSGDFVMLKRGPNDFYNGGSWRSMFVSQPPPLVIECYFKFCVDGSIVPEAELVNNARGVTVGDVVDGFRKWEDAKVEILWDTAYFRIIDVGCATLLRSWRCCARLLTSVEEMGSNGKRSAAPGREVQMSEVKPVQNRGAEFRDSWPYWAFREEACGDIVKSRSMVRASVSQPPVCAMAPPHQPPAVQIQPPQQRSPIPHPPHFMFQYEDIRKRV